MRHVVVIGVGEYSLYGGHIERYLARLNMEDFWICPIAEGSYCTMVSYDCIKERSADFAKRMQAQFHGLVFIGVASGLAPMYIGNLPPRVVRVDSVTVRSLDQKPRSFCVNPFDIRSQIIKRFCASSSCAESFRNLAGLVRRQKEKVLPLTNVQGLP